MNLPKSEKYVPPKELPDALEALGIYGFTVRSSRVLIAACRAEGVPVIRGKYIRPSAVAAWLAAHPKWKPFGGLS